MGKKIFTKDKKNVKFGQNVVLKSSFYKLKPSDWSLGENVLVTKRFYNFALGSNSIVKFSCKVTWIREEK